MCVFTVAGMIIFGGQLENPRANFSSFGRGMLTLFQVFTGDSWSGVLYEGMAVACKEDEAAGSGFTFASFYITFLWVGQFVFITMFLGLILENFAVEDFMTVEKPEADEDMYKELDVDEAKEIVAHFQRLPIEAVDEMMLLDVFNKNNAAFHGGLIHKNDLLRYVRKNAPMNRWRALKKIGFVWVRSCVRNYLCCCLPLRNNSWMEPWPGDVDWISEKELEEAAEPPQLTRDQRVEAWVAHNADELRLHMTRLVKLGMEGEVRMVAKKEGLELNPMGIR
eukprot:CAMPEP_0169477824 /NCGR_PEP_ID=MMETSP1042-20121227/28139_1 /TAXON_ID=464988 /ORGANISM="Hemiselmis andersenii, Strain CCMP1180" /LENGTH=278 /DNA_ID=CAMNT_0009592233 /DNA_START=36 /DNA_END=869 /DNA_ORIENTATION=-